MNRLPILGKAMDVDFSPFLDSAPELLLPDDSAPIAVHPEVLRPYGGIFRLPGSVSPELGAKVRIRFTIRDGGTVTLLGAVAQTTRTHDGSPSLLVNFLALVEHTGNSHSLENGAQIPCPPDYLPLAWGEHPWFFKHRLHFKIQSFTAGGMRLQFGEEAKAVGKNMQLRLRVVLPSVDVFDVDVRVVDTDYTDGRKINYCTVRFVNPDPGFLAAVSRYLFANVSGVCRTQTEALGYPFPAFESASSCRYVFNDEQLRENLALRLKAYRNREGARLDKITEPEQMKDRFDDHSLIFSILVGGKTVGTGRLVLNDGRKERSEIGSMVELPDWLWRAGFVEFSRFATDENYRGRDVFASLGLHASRVAHQLGYRYIVADCEDTLLPTYRRRGARPLGLKFVHPLEGAHLHVIYYDTYFLNLAGRILTPRRWSQTWGSVLQYYRR